MKYRSVILLIALSSSLNGQTILSIADSAIHNRRLHFIPTSFSNKFSLNVTPVLTIRAGDTVNTETIDAMGFDKNGVKRQRGGNPLTGPFYIENAFPGDVLAITLNKISLNRSYAHTTETFVSRSVPDSVTKKLKKTRLVKWNFDKQRDFASPDSAYEHLGNFKVPLHPFLGCIGVAPSNKKNEKLSFFPGAFGGNLDFSSVKQSSTIYLPVFHEGAFLYIGDGHAMQGDGEIAGNALETSLDVEFSVKLIKKEILQLKYPRVEDSIYIMSVGVNKKLEDALKIATSGLLDWLQIDYHLSLEEATQVISTSIEYSIAQIADPEVEVVAKIKKEILKGLKKYD